MAEEKKKGFPKIPRGNWFLLREKFKQRAPERVSPSYIASALAMTEASASANIIPPLRAFGLIDETGKPTDLAYDWRDDSKYAEVCGKIVEAVYPQELRDLFHTKDADLSRMSNWFARNAKVGEAAAIKYASTYGMLLEADLSKAKEPSANKQKQIDGAPVKVPKVTVRAKAEKAAGKKPEDGKAVRQHDDGRADDSVGRRGFSPKLHVDIQIHISPDSSPEQIDKIFESMAKHLPLTS